MCTCQQEVRRQVRLPSPLAHSQKSALYFLLACSFDNPCMWFVYMYANQINAVLVGIIGPKNNNKNYTTRFLVEMAVDTYTTLNNI